MVTVSQGGGAGARQRYSAWSVNPKIEVARTLETFCTSERAVQKTPSSQRWIPPTAREPLTPNELVFRKVRGILNKLTPDNFERLINELMHHAGVSSRDTLKGTILLVFDKALDEPSYSSMYAQLCLRLNDFTANLEETGGQNTLFRKLLLHKCQEEFENRRQATAAFDKRDGLTPEEEEQKIIAKRKMLGNIKFVGELFKLGMLHEAIIHSCIKELLEKKRSQSMEDASKSLECLCHIMTNVGEKLDTEKAKGWMGQYFERMQSLSDNKELPSRIRFMLMDVIELRKNKWLPRRSNIGSGPRPIHEIRQEMYQEQQPRKAHSGPPAPLSLPSQQPFRSGSAPYYLPPPGGDEGFLSSPPGLKDHLLSPQETEAMATFSPPHTDPLQPKQPLPQEGEKQIEKKLIRKLPSGKRDDTVSLRPSMASMKLGAGRRRASPSASPTPEHHVGGGGKETGRGDSRSPIPRTRDDSSDEEGPPSRSTKVNKPPGLVPYPPLGPPGPPYPLPPGPYPPYMMPPRGDPFMDVRGRPLPPHLPPHTGMMPMHMIPGGPRPMMYMSPRMVPGMPPPSVPHRQFGPLPPPPGGYFGPPPPRGSMGPYPPPMYGPPRPLFGPLPQWLPPMTAEQLYLPPEGEKGPLPPALERAEPVIVKYASSKSGKKGASSSGGRKPTQEDSERLMEPIIEQFLDTLELSAAVEGIERLQGASKEDVCKLLITKTLEKSEDARTHISDLLYELYSRSIITSAHFLQSFNKIMSSISDSESPQSKTYVAGFVARAISKEMVSFSDIAPTFDQGAHHPTVLVVLQAMAALIGEEAVLRAVQESGRKLVSLLPLSHRSHDTISDLMDSRKLGFLYPLKRIQSELSGKLRQDATAVTIYKWIKNNVAESFYSTPEFVMVLTRCILDHVTRGSSLGPGAGRQKSEPPSKEIIASEKEAMMKLKILVQKFVSESIPLQISTLYATQVFCHDKQFPKGLLLRLFSYWYEMDVVDEEAFLGWKEDISQEYPGKGDALFQVNQWLVLLAEADEEGNSSEEED